MEVRGVLWVIDELHGHGVATPTTLLGALNTLETDPAVRLPRRDIALAIRRYRNLR